MIYPFSFGINIVFCSELTLFDAICDYLLNPTVEN